MSVPKGSTMIYQDVVSTKRRPEARLFTKRMCLDLGLACGHTMTAKVTAGKIPERKRCHACEAAGVAPIEIGEHVYGVVLGRRR